MLTAMLRAHGAQQTLAISASRERFGVQVSRVPETSRRMSAVGSHGERPDKQSCAAPNGGDLVEACRASIDHGR